MDILIILDVMGFGFYFEIGEGFCFKNLIMCKVDVDKIGFFDLEGEL